jgi:hypothetical protein
VKAKTAALVLLGSISLVAPLIERWATGRVEAFSAFDVGATFVSVALIFWWYHADKRERNYEAGALMNTGVVAASVLALPIYFVRSRGWKQGMIASAFAAAVLAATYLLGEAGEWLGETFNRG